MCVAFVCMDNYVVHVSTCIDIMMIVVLIDDN